MRNHLDLLGWVALTLVAGASAATGCTIIETPGTSAGGSSSSSSSGNHVTVGNVTSTSVGAGGYTASTSNATTGLTASSSSGTGGSTGSSGGAGGSSASAGVGGYAGGPATASSTASASTASASAGSGGGTGDTWTNFAAPFIEHYCSGCHHPGYTIGTLVASTDGSTRIHLYTTDPNWVQDGSNPTEAAQGFANVNWFTALSYQNVVADNVVIGCSLVPASDPIPAQCATLTWTAQEAMDSGGLVTAGASRFPKQERFPPVGGVDEDHLGDGMHCWWTDASQVGAGNEGSSCEMPTTADRRRFIAWIQANNPK